MDKKTYGFTMLELVVSIAILGGVGLVLSQIFISTFRTNTKTEILKEVKQNGEFALEVLTRMIQNSTAITSACTGASSKSIVITSPDGFQTTFGCVLDGTTTRLASQSASTTYYLTSSSVSLGGANCAASNISFVCEKTLGLPSTVFVSMTLGQVGAAVDQFERSSAVFQTTISTRNVPIN